MPLECHHSYDRAHTTCYWRSEVTMALSRVVSEIFNVEKCRDLEIQVRGHSVSSKVVPFHRLCMVSYLVFYSNFVRKMHRFWDIRLVTIQWPWNPGYGSFKVIGTDTCRSATYDFPLTFHSYHGPSRTVSEIYGDFSQKSQNFRTPFYFASPLKWFPFELGTDAGSQCRIIALPGRQRSLTISSAVRIECTNVTDRRTDRQTDGHRATAKTALKHSVAR